MVRRLSEAIPVSKRRDISKISPLQVYKNLVNERNVEYHYLCDGDPVGVRELSSMSWGQYLAFLNSKYIFNKRREKEMEKKQKKNKKK